MLGLRIAKNLLLPRITCMSLARRAIFPQNYRALSQLTMAPLTRAQASVHGPMHKIIGAITRPYSTKTAPPGPDKNARGKVLLHKITGFTTFSASLLLVVAGAGFCGLVLYLILSELFLPSGDTKTFNKAVSLVEKNALAQEALGLQPGDRLKAYGEVAGDKWVRNRPVQSVRLKGQDGKDHLAMRFHVESDAGKHGSVFLEQMDTSFWSSEFAYIALELPSKKRIYIVEPKFATKNYVPKTGVFAGSGFLGLSWGPKKD